MILSHPDIFSIFDLTKIRDVLTGFLRLKVFNTG